MRQIKTSCVEKRVLNLVNQRGGVFSMGTRVSYPAEVKMKAIEMKLLGIPAKQIMDELNIKNVSQLKTWMKWYKAGEVHRLHLPVGKQYSFGKGPDFDSEESRLQTENRYLKQQVEVLKKYKELEWKWLDKHL